VGIAGIPKMKNEAYQSHLKDVALFAEAKGVFEMPWREREWPRGKVSDIPDVCFSSSKYPEYDKSSCNGN